MNANTFHLTLIFSFPLNFLLCVHNSFKNLAYLGICLMASMRGILTSTFLKVSRISLSMSSFALDCVNLFGKGRRMEDCCLGCFRIICWGGFGF